MEELICSVEFLRGVQEVVARVSSEAGGVREYRALSAGAVIDQVINDLQEEFESAPSVKPIRQRGSRSVADAHMY